MSILTDKYWSRMTFLMDYRTGSTRELVTGIDPVVAGTPRMRPGVGLDIGTVAANKLTYGNNFNITDGTQPFTVAAIFQQDEVQKVGFLAYKASGGASTPCFNFYISAGVLGWNMGFDGTHVLTHNLTLAQKSGRFVYVMSYNGTWATSCMMSLCNGVWQSVTTVTGAVPSMDWSYPAGAFTVGRQHTSYPGGKYISLVAKFTGALTPAQMTELYEGLRSEQTARSRPFRHFSFPFPARTPAEYAAEGCILDLDCTGFVNGKVIEHVAGKHFTSAKSGNDVTKKGPFGGQIMSPGGTSGGLQNPNIGNAALSGGAMSVEAWVKPMSSDVNKTVLLTGGGIQLEGNTTGFSFYQDVGGLKFGRVAATLPSKDIHVVATMPADSTVPTLYIDGVATALTTSAAGPLVFSANAAMKAGYYSTLTAIAFAGGQTKHSLYNRVLTGAEVRQKYLQGARTVLFDGRLPRDGSCPVTPVTLSGVGAQIPGTPWVVSAAGGTAKLSEEAPIAGRLGRRYVAITGTCAVRAQDSSPPYGSWYAQLYFGNFVNTLIFASDPSGTNYRGYVVGVHAGQHKIQLLTTGSSDIVAGGTAVAENWYEYWIDRTRAGVWSLWVRGGTYAAWTLIGSATNATYTTCKFMQYAISAAPNYLGDVIHYLG